MDKKITDEDRLLKKQKRSEKIRKALVHFRKGLKPDGSPLELPAHASPPQSRGVIFDKRGIGVRRRKRNGRGKKYGQENN